MAFCKACGTQLEGSEKFCVKCGTPVTANGVATPVAAAAQATAVPIATAAAAPPVGSAAPPAYPPPGGLPMVMPPPPAAKKGGMFWVVALVVLGLGAWYYNKHHPQNTGPGSQPGTGPSQSGQTGTAPAGTAPGAAPQPGTPVQPGDPGPGGANAALVALQAVSGDWRTYGGYIQEYNVRWTNRSSVPIQTAIMECDQYAATDEVLAQNRTTLNGPVLPGGTGTYNPFLMGVVQPYLKSVNCGIVAVTPAN
jgi:hypothetical protein